MAPVEFRTSRHRWLSLRTTSVSLLLLVVVPFPTPYVWWTLKEVGKGKDVRHIRGRDGIERLPR